MSYKVSFKYVIDESNPDSLTQDIAWQANIFTDKHNLICIARNNGTGSGTELEWWDDYLQEEMYSNAIQALPDSIDPLRDYIDQLIEAHLG